MKNKNDIDKYLKSEGRFIYLVIVNTFVAALILKSLFCEEYSLLLCNSVVLLLGGLCLKDCIRRRKDG